MDTPRGHDYSAEITASGHARLHNGDHHGNVYNANTNYYTTPQQLSDRSLTNGQRNRELLQAAGEGQTRRVDVLIRKYGADVDYADDDGFTALHHASGDGFADVVENLVSKHGADVNALSSRYGTPLCLAACNGRTEIFHFLLANRARVDLDAGDFGSVLHAAIYGGDVSMVQVLIDQKGMSVDLQATLDLGLLAELYSAESYSEGEWKLFEVEGGGIEQCCAIHLACFRENAEMLKLLTTRYSASVNAECRMRGSSGRHAEYEEEANIQPINLTTDDECIRHLLSLKPDIDHATSSGVTAAMKIAGAGQRESLELLSSAGANLEAQDLDGQSALHYAAGGGHVNCVDFLCAKTDATDVQNKWACTALFLAIKNNHVDCVAQLLEHGAKANTERQTAMHLALKQKATEVIKLLASRSDGFNNLNVIIHGVSPLMRAVINEDLDMVDLMLRVGADVHLADSEGQTATSIASAQKSCDILERLHQEAEKDYPLLDALVASLERLRLPDPKVLVEDDELADRYLGKRLRVALRERLGRHVLNQSDADVAKALNPTV